MINKNTIAELINENTQLPDEEIIQRLKTKLYAAECAGDYKAQADYWQEQYQTFIKHCQRIINKPNGIRAIRKALEEDVGILTI